MAKDCDNAHLSMHKLLSKITLPWKVPYWKEDFVRNCLSVMTTILDKYDNSNVISWKFRRFLTKVMPIIYNQSSSFTKEHEIAQRFSEHKAAA